MPKNHLFTPAAEPKFIFARASDDFLCTCGNDAMAHDDNTYASNRSAVVHRVVSSAELTAIAMSASAVTILCVGC